MTNVFISYERSAEATARSVADLLRARGFDTWSDAQIPPHRDYGDVITERLAAADAVLVLWSDGAAQSHWVRAEADFALEHGKLVQAALDATPLPLPFNRIQCAKLIGWSGATHEPEWMKVVASIEQLSTGQVAPSVPPRAEAVVRKPRGRSGRSLWIGVGVAAIVLAAAALWIPRGSPRNAPPSVARVAVLPFETLSAGEEARFFAAGLTDQIVTTLSSNHIQVVSRDDAVTLRGPDRERKLAELGVALLFDGTVRHDGDNIDAKVHLEDAREHAVIWSTEIEGAAADSAQLQDRIAHTIVGVLACSNRALRPGNGLTDPALLSRYLRACDIFANQNDGMDPRDTLEMLAALREVTTKAPDFAAAHSDLAKFDAYLAPLAPPEQAASMRAEAASEAKRALAVEPKSPDAYLAEFMLAPINQWAERERLLREGIATDPDWPHTNGFLAMMLSDVGRLTEATMYARKAAAADLQIDWSATDVFLAAGAGQPNACIETLSRKVKLDPRRAGEWGQLLSCQVWAGHWDAAHDMLAAPSAPTAGLRVNAAWTAFVLAAKTRAPADLAAARDLALAAVGESGLAKWSAIQDVAYLGYLDDAFALAEKFTPYVDGAPDFLFLPTAAAMRKDPRFIKLAARIGLVDYWTKSGHWPDFCNEPGLPYDCRDEAARLAK